MKVMKMVVLVPFNAAVFLVAYIGAFLWVGPVEAVKVAKGMLL